jgi:hypothetical protein
MRLRHNLARSNQPLTGKLKPKVVAGAPGAKPVSEILTSNNRRRRPINDEQSMILIMIMINDEELHACPGAACFRV